MSNVGDKYRKLHVIQEQRGEDERIDFLLDFVDMLHDALDRQVELTEIYMIRRRLSLPCVE